MNFHPKYVDLRALSSIVANVKPILAMPRFWERLLPKPLPKNDKWNVIMMTTATSMKEMTLNPRQSPKSPPSDEKKSTQVILALRSISEEDILCSSHKGLRIEKFDHIHTFRFR